MSTQSQSLDELKSTPVLREKKADDLAGSLLALNNLDYRFPSSLSVATRRRMIRNQSNKTLYTEGDKIIIHLNTGSSYIYGPNSFLTFQLKSIDNVGAPIATTNPFGYKGSSKYCIRDVVVTSASGTELSRNLSANIQSRMLDRWTCDRQYTDKFGQVSGYRDHELSMIAVGSLVNDGATVHADSVVLDLQAGKQFCIPMKDISPIFAQQKLIPSFMASGMRIEITLESAQKAFRELGVFMEVSDPTIVTDTFEDTASSKGLEFFWVESDRTRAVEQGEKYNVTMRKSVSRALSVLGVTRFTTAISSDIQDSIQSSIYTVDNYQFRLGSNYYPNTPVPQSDNYAEHYINAQYAVDALSSICSKPNGVSLADFRFVGDGLLGATLEKSAVLNLSGESSGIGRSLQLEATMATGNPATEIDLFLYYVKLCKVFPSNLLVKE